LKTALNRNEDKELGRVPSRQAQSLDTTDIAHLKSAIAKLPVFHASKDSFSTEGVLSHSCTGCGRDEGRRGDKALEEIERWR
jgi:hypothetical protein